MSRRLDNHSFSNPKVIVIVNERPGPSSNRRVLNNPSIASQNHRNSNDTGVEIEMPRKWPSRKPGPSHAMMINRDKRIEVVESSWRGEGPREQRIVEKVQTKNRVYQPLGLIRKAGIAPAATESHQPSRHIGNRKPIEAPSLSDIIINQRPLKSRLAVAGGKAERLIELAPIEEASSSSVPLVRPRPTRVVQVKEQSSQEKPVDTASERRIKRSLLNPILPPGVEKPTGIKVVVIDQNEASNLGNSTVNNNIIEEKDSQSPTDSQAAQPEEKSVATVISKELEENVKETLTVSPAKEEATASNNLVESSALSDVSTDSVVLNEGMLRVFPQKQTYDPEKMTVADREIMEKDIQRTRKRKTSPESSRSTSPKMSPRKKPEFRGHLRAERPSNKVRIYAEKREKKPKDGNKKEQTPAVVTPLPTFNFPDALRSRSSREMIIPYANGPDYIFSNEYQTAELNLCGKMFTCPLHYSWWRKAKFCGNDAIASKILECADFQQMMDHASTLKCDEDEWKQLNWKYIVEANYTKYQQFELARFHLFQTIDARIVEADPNETYWSIGLDIKDKDVSDPHKWMGANVMGKALMEIRDLLAERREYAEEKYCRISSETGPCYPKRSRFKNITNFDKNVS